LLVFGATVLVTAPLTILFVRDAFGTRSLGALAGLIKWCTRSSAAALGQARRQTLGPLVQRDGAKP
jgi:hypothetical protein